ncbi:MAG: single-stranded DNA-binding protein [Aeriscardovia sp.]|nr:single-stranded DNA-binding protein [Aeriscardovia sp.]MBR3462743.1 single-stranded DNA-binding protein [Clostridiales bacterium]MCR4766961.1 single-stranded DNA-binding protein [Saccharofermentans sp.]
MNKVELVGRLTKDPEVKVTSNQTQFCNFTIAVDRRFKDQNGQRQADFINCVAWRQTAVFIQKYFRKGSRIGLVGSIQTRTYDDQQSGQKRYITEVVIDEAEFVESSGSASGDVYRQEPAAPTQSFNPPPANTVAASAPTAPNMQIEAPMGGFDEGQSGELPFEI